MRLLKAFFHYDNIIGTAFIFLTLLFFSWTIDKFNFEWLDPVSQAIGDVKLTDITYSVTETKVEIDDRIVIVNIGNLPRIGIAEQVRNIAKYKPKVLAIDALMPAPHPDSDQDASLANALGMLDNVVLATKGELYTDETNTFDSLLDPHGPFLAHSQRGLVNLITDGEQAFRVCRTFVPQMNVSSQASLRKDTVLSAFAVQVASIYDKEKVDRFLARGMEEEFINYTGNIQNLNMHDMGPRTIKYTCLDVEQALNEYWGDPEDLFKDKIVLMGYLGKDFYDYSWEDKFYTPLNEKVAGKAIPDMFGVVVHANIISMILDENYIEQIHDGWEYLITILLVYLTTVFFRWIYNDLKVWYDGLTKLVSIIAAGFLFAFLVYLYAEYQVNVSITIGVVAMLLAGDLLEIYFGVIRNLGLMLVTFTKKTVLKVKKAQ